MTIKYDKLVRDRIPEIIRASGRKASVRTASAEEVRTYLVRKVAEEATELAENPSLEELADLLEVLHALAREMNVDLGQLEQVRLKKREARGGFEQRVVLLETD